MEAPMAMATTGVKMDFEKLIKKGENPRGFTSQTANGTAHWKGTGVNRNYPYTMEPLPPDATHPEGRSNRTGE
jgi:hypothetical protein